MLLLLLSLWSRYLLLLSSSFVMNWALHSVVDLVLPFLGHSGRLLIAFKSHKPKDSKLITSEMLHARSPTSTALEMLNLLFACKHGRCLWCLWGGQKTRATLPRLTSTGKRRHSAQHSNFYFLSTSGIDFGRRRCRFQI